jgi:hypothetical protein
VSADQRIDFDSDPDFDLEHPTPSTPCGDSRQE